MDFEWTKRPTSIQMWNTSIPYVMFVDENNTGNLKMLLKKIKNNQSISNDEKYFTLTGCILTSFDYQILKNDFETLKLAYWKEGIYYKDSKPLKVCFHSNEIRRRTNAFSIQLIDHSKFVEELSSTIKKINFKIISININIFDYVLKGYPLDIYSMGFNLILEEFIKFLPHNNTALIMFESRGKKEDYSLLSHMTSTICCTGTTNYTSNRLMSQIKGIYFNSKRNPDNTITYSGLELADLVSYPIHKYVKNGVKDLAFLAIEDKFEGFPNCINKGLKLFP